MLTIALDCLQSLIAGPTSVAGDEGLDTSRGCYMIQVILALIYSCSKVVLPIISGRHICPSSIALTSLLHLQPQEIGLWAAQRFRVVTLPLVKGIAALIESVDLVLTFALLI